MTYDGGIRDQRHRRSGKLNRRNGDQHAHPVGRQGNLIYTGTTTVRAARSRYRFRFPRAGQHGTAADAV